MTRLIRFGIVPAVLVVCMASTAIAQAADFRAHLSGGNFSPPRETKATGNAMFTLNGDRTMLEFHITVGNIENVVGVQLQRGTSTDIGPVVATLYGPVAPGGGRANGVLAKGAIAGSNLVGDLAGQSIAALVSEIQAGRIYVNVLTDDGVGASDERAGDFSTGEIRGQVR